MNRAVGGPGQGAVAVWSDGSGGACMLFRVYRVRCTLQHWAVRSTSPLSTKLDCDLAFCASGAS